MPEQLTKHPEVTLQVLRSAGARCGEGVTPEILKACPADRFCRLPGGEICVYGLAEAGRMTQIAPAEWRAVLGPAAPGTTIPPGGLITAPPAPLLAGGIGLALGAALAVILLRPWRGR